ncbi:hypothetical protein [Nostoc sp.]|uniref:hypothetical protein n=1 Tax=Nostoc sp. TaxID=1180 RepID=UPI002FF72D13
MKSWQFNISLCLTASLVGIIATLVTQTAWAEAKLENRDKFLQKGVDHINQQINYSNLGVKRSYTEGNRLDKRVKQDKKVLILKGEGKIRQLSELERPSTSATMLVQTLNIFEAETSLKPIQDKGNTPKAQKRLKPRYIKKTGKTMSKSLCI